MASPGRRRGPSEVSETPSQHECNDDFRSRAISRRKDNLIGRVLGEFSELRLLDLDAEDGRSVKLIQAAGGDPDGWVGRWCRDVECIRREESIGGDLIVDVGAGSLQTREGQCFFIARREAMIAVTAPWQVVLARHPGRNAEEFQQTEYSADRKEVYRSAAVCVPSTSGIDKSAKKFRQALRKLLK